MHYCINDVKEFARHFDRHLFKLLEDHSRGIFSEYFFYKNVDFFQVFLALFDQIVSGKLGLGALVVGDSEEGAFNIKRQVAKDLLDILLADTLGFFKVEKFKNELQAIFETATSQE